MEQDRTIRIAAGLLTDAKGRALLVRKRGTLFFMQPGGKMEKGESPCAALCRELREELGIVADAPSLRSLGQFIAPAANEQGYLVNAAVFHLHAAGDIRAAAEIEQAIWHDPAADHPPPLAPLTRDHLLPILLEWRRAGKFGKPG